MDRHELIRAGDHRAIAGLIRDLDDGRAGAEAELSSLRGAEEAPFVVGITGPPGAGKSTLVDALCTRLRARGERVGIVAVDPSSPQGGGAILGDRIRMQAHATDPGVFIRSLGTRGASGGLSVSAAHVAAALGVGGFRTVLIETVGVGQAELDVATIADVAVVVMVPGLGDDIQALKAGLLELADVLVVNKGDRPGADQTLADLRAMLELRRSTGADAGEVALLRVVATTGDGIDELLGAIEAARRTAPDGQRKATRRVEQALLARLTAEARQALAPGGLAAELVAEVTAGRIDSKTALGILMERLRGGYSPG
jgi:LAO/AO transport system kinase